MRSLMARMDVSSIAHQHGDDTLLLHPILYVVFVAKPKRRKRISRAEVERAEHVDSFLHDLHVLHGLTILQVTSILHFRPLRLTTSD